MVHSKGQVGFSAAEIQNRHFPVPWKLREDILNKFQKTVDLAKFIIFCMDNFPILGLDSQIHQKPHFFPRV